MASDIPIVESKKLALASCGCSYSRQMQPQTMNRSYRRFSVSVFAIAAFITAAAEARSPTLHRWTSLDWTHWDVPLFSLYGPFDHKPDVSTVANEVRHKKSALDVYGFDEVILASDDKGLTIGLDERDTRILKILAQKYDRRWFVAVAPPKDLFMGEASISAVYMTLSMADGHIVLKHPECASVARSLRLRFRIAEFRLTPW